MRRPLESFAISPSAHRSAIQSAGENEVSWVFSTAMPVVSIVSTTLPPCLGASAATAGAFARQSVSSAADADGM